MIGKTIGKYRFVGQLGRGGMGTVYKAVDETLDREVAIKVLNPELADSEIMKRFRTEATTLAKLNHPDIATIYELYRSESDLLMVMEFVRGETLDKLSARVGTLPPERAASLVDRVLGALEHAHRAGVVHRDMKPANVMVTEHGGVKIMDFGIARMVGAEHMTVDGYMMGTPAYMPPEQVLGHEVDGRADLYSVGVVFYRLLTNALPFKADTAIGMVQKQISEPPMPLHLHRDGLPEWCESLLQRALAKSPAERFQTAEEFRSALATATGMTVPGLTRGVASTDVEATPAPARHPTPSGAPPIAPDGATIVIARKHFAFAGSALAVLAVGVAALAFVALKRPTQVPAAASGTGSEAAVAVGPPPSAALLAPPAGLLAPVGPTAAIGTLQSPAGIVAGATISAGSTPKPSGSLALPVVPAVPPGRKAPVTNAMHSDPAAGVSYLRPPMPPLMFDARTLVTDGKRWNEREATLLLAENVTLTADNNVLRAIPYSGVQSVTYSHGREPLMNGVAGPEPVVKVGGGFLSVFRGDRHWITLHTRDAFVVVRVDDNRLNPVLDALAKRTNRPVERVAPRKDDR